MVANNINKEAEEDKLKRFENEGVVFKAKLIGTELVMEPRGDKMCQNSIQRLKAIIKGTNSHKKRIVLKISFEGVKVYDEKTNEMLYHHEVSQISYIASDDTDSRTFGYVSDIPNKAHQFICFKTSGPAVNVMSVISALFEAVLEKKKQEEEKEKKEEKHKPAGEKFTETKHQDSVDLIGDSGIIDGDISLVSNDSLINYKPDEIKSTSERRQPSRQNPLPIPIRQNQPQPIPIRQGQHPILLPPPSSLPRPTPMNMSSGPSHNRSLVYNHSSVSLSDAALMRQSSFNAPNQNDSYVDRYAVFNDIDNLPSIFESVSLGSVNKATVNAPLEPLGPVSSSTIGARSTSSTDTRNMFRQTNPFDDDFFA